MAQSATSSIIGLPLVSPPPPGLQEATKNSTVAWQEDLEALFRHAKDRFPDVVWELIGDENDPYGSVEEVWGHKAIVYARAPPSFQTRYFSFRANGITSPSPYPSSPSGFNYPAESALSLGMESSLNLLRNQDPDRTPSPFQRAASPSNTTAVVTQPGPTSTLRLTTSLNPALFSNELEYLYTGKGFGEAFEFLFDSSESRDRTPGGLLGNGEDDDKAESLRIDKLRKDLVFMWRSRLYSDVRIALTGNFGSSSGHHESTTAIFSSHRFILVSRSSYFHTALLAWPVHKNAVAEPPTLTLPSPPFTPASLHFTLGFIYTGTLIFSHRSYDLSTAFTIMKAALYLSLDTLHDEIQARIVQEMCHGLFHAFIPFAEYENLTGGKWGTGGCRCRQCARRAPRVLEFSLEEDSRNPNLERGARRALVGLFGEGWCTQEFAALSPKLRDSILRGVGKRTTPLNVFPLLFAAEHALAKLGNVIEPWGDTVREMVLQARKSMDELLCRESDACFKADEWMELMENNAVRFDDGERVEWVNAAIMRGVKEQFAPVLYQTLVSAILLRPHPTDTNEPFLSPNSQIHMQVEQTRIELLRWIGKRWLDIRQQSGFDPLEDWALKEISDHLEVPIDDLLSPPSYSSPKGAKAQSHLHLRPISNHPHTSKADAESDAASSMRVSLLSRNFPMRQGNASSASVSASYQSANSGSPSMSRDRDRVDSRSSIHSARSARSATTVSSVASNSTISAAPRGQHHRSSAANNGGDSPARRFASDVRASRLKQELRDRPDSKLTPSPRMQPSIVEPEQDTDDQEEDNMDVDEDEGDRTMRVGDVAQTLADNETDHGLSDAGDEQNSMENEHDNQEEVQSRSSMTDSVYHTPSAQPQRRLISRTSVSSVASSARLGGSSTAPRPKSLAPSIKSLTPSRKPATPSIRTSPTTTRPSSRGSTHSTATGTGRTRVTSKPGVPATSASRPSSRVSTTSMSSRPISTASALTSAESTRTYRTASSGGGGGLSTPIAARSRRISAASTASVRTAGGNRSAAGSPVNERKRKISGASVSSVASNAGSTRSTKTTTRKTGVGATPMKRAPSLPVADPFKLSPAAAARSPRSPAMQTSFSVGATASPNSPAVKRSVSGSTSSLAPKKVVTPKKSTESLRKSDTSKKPSAQPSPAPASASSTLTPKAAASTPPSRSPATETPPALPEKDVESSPPPPKVAEKVEKENMVPSSSLLLSPPAPSSASSDSSTATATLPDTIPNTSSTITIKPKTYHPEGSSPGNEHKKSSSAASISSIATLKRKGSTDTIKTVKSSGLSIISDNAPKSSSTLSTTASSPPLPPVPGSLPASPSPSHSSFASFPSSSSPISKSLSPLHPNSKQSSSFHSSIDSVLASDKPTGATLEIGIPCIISSKRKRFKAYARYIGEVIGETGPWVGVEVPLPIGSTDAAWGVESNNMMNNMYNNAMNGRPNDVTQWNDGSLGGIRYFEIGGMGSEWGDYGSGGGIASASYEDRAARRRRLEGVSGSFSSAGGGSILGREGSKGFMNLKRDRDRERDFDQLSIASDRMKRMRSVSPAVSDMSGTESMGLFVRPQQVLYVVDAVGSDL